MEQQAHSFIIWQSGFKHLSRIFWELSREFEIKYAEKIVWGKDRVAENLNRVYPNRQFNSLSPKIKSIGGNVLVFILVVDKKPIIKDGVNLRAFDYKQIHRYEGRRHSAFRRRMKNINYLHASDLEKDAFFNFQALTGKSKDEFNELVNRESVLYMKQGRGIDFQLKELSAVKFSKIEDVFGFLNNNVKYTVLRNWDDFSGGLISEEHSDIDILTDDYYGTLLLLRARPFFKEDYRVHHLVKIGERLIPFDVRHVGDDYYDKGWEKRMLNNCFLDNGFYRLSDENYFWSLLYHAVFHKGRIAEDYKEKLKSLGQKIDGFVPQVIDDYESAKKFLKKYLTKNNIKITKPKDKSVYFQRHIWDKLGLYSYFAGRIAKNLFKKEIVSLSYLGKYKSFAFCKDKLKRAIKIKNGVFRVGDLIIKIAEGDRKFLLRNEEKILRKLSNYKFFPKVVNYFQMGQRDCLILERIDGVDLYRKFKLSKKQCDNFVKGLDEIIEILQKENIVHRDLRPHNLMITGDGTPYLIDFQFAILNGREIEAESDVEKYLLENCKKNLGGEWYKDNFSGNEADAALRKLDLARGASKTVLLRPILLMNSARSQPSFCLV